MSASRRGSLVAQFLGESIFLTMGALLLAFCITEVVLTLTPFNALMGKSLQLDLVRDPWVFFWSGISAVVLGLLSGLYPAVFISSFQPVDALKGQGGSRFGGGKTASNMRKAMVLVQFTIAIAVIICTFLMRNQVEYMRHQDLGFSSENIAVIPINDSITRGRLPEIRREIEALPHVHSTTMARNVPGHSVGRTFLQVVSTEGKAEEVVMDLLNVGTDYVKGMGMELISGEGFRKAAYTDSTLEFIVNETAEKELFGGKAMGREIVWGLPLGDFKEFRGPVVGVVKDFSVHSLHFQRRPLVLVPAEQGEGMLHVRIGGGNAYQTINQIRSIWAPHEANGSPFDFFFIDESFDKLYDADQRNSGLMGILAYVCMVISALGLIGFASYSIVQRRREIGIRKVLGASMLRILLWLFADIFYLVLAASLAGSILALVVFQLWLGEFAYHAEIPLGTFFYTGFGVMLVALVTVGLHSLRAAMERPVHALRIE